MSDDFGSPPFPILTVMGCIAAIVFLLLLALEGCGPTEEVDLSAVATAGPDGRCYLSSVRPHEPSPTDPDCPCRDVARAVRDGGEMRTLRCRSDQRFVMEWAPDLAPTVTAGEVKVGRKRGSLSDESVAGVMRCVCLRESGAVLGSVVPGAPEVTSVPLPPGTATPFVLMTPPASETR